MSWGRRCPQADVCHDGWEAGKWAHCSGGYFGTVRTLTPLDPEIPHLGIDHKAILSQYRKNGWMFVA